MGGFFGVSSRRSCVADLFYGTDYHSHLGTMRGGMAVAGPGGFSRAIHDITNAPFRHKFESDLRSFEGNAGIGIISDYEDQPLIIGSHLGAFAIVTVGVINNIDELVTGLQSSHGVHFSEMGRGGVNPTELVAAMIVTQPTIEHGIRHAQERIAGSCSILVLTEKGQVYAGRDYYGRTPIILGQSDDGLAVATESCSFQNLGYHWVRDLGPGEVVRLDADGAETLLPPGDRMAICAFLWVYYGYPASTYEGRNVEEVRYACGAALARRDDGTPAADSVAGVPDSGVGHALGYAQAAGIAYARPYVKYTPTWPRSFMPQIQEHRDLIARMKLIPIPELIRGRSIVFLDDSIVRGTQLRDQVHRLYDDGAREIHIRIACPPLLYGCPFLNFSRSRSVMDLAARRAIHELEGDNADVAAYRDPDGEKHQAMVGRIGQRLGLTSLRYQRLDDLTTAIGVAPGQLCTYCWSGEDVACKGGCACACKA